MSKSGSESAESRINPEPVLDLICRAGTNRTCSYLLSEGGPRAPHMREHLYKNCSHFPRGKTRSLDGPSHASISPGNTLYLTHLSPFPPSGDTALQRQWLPCPTLCHACPAPAGRMHSPGQPESLLGRKGESMSSRRRACLPSPLHPRPGLVQSLTSRPVPLEVSHGESAESFYLLLPLPPCWTGRHRSQNARSGGPTRWASLVRRNLLPSSKASGMSPTPSRASPPVSPGCNPPLCSATSSLSSLLAAPGHSAPCPRL